MLNGGPRQIECRRRPNDPIKNMSLFGSITYLLAEGGSGAAGWLLVPRLDGAGWDHHRQAWNLGVRSCLLQCEAILDFLSLRSTTKLTE